MMNWALRGSRSQFHSLNSEPSIEDLPFYKTAHNRLLCQVINQPNSSFIKGFDNATHAKRPSLQRGAQKYS